MSYAASMNADEFKNRTKAFAIRVIRLVEALPQNQTAKVIGNQLLRCGTSVGANYRAACRAKSPADLVAKMAIVEDLRLGRTSEHRAVERVERGIYRNRPKRSCVYRFSSDFQCVKLP